LSSSNYLRTVSEDYDDRVRSTIESAIRYNKRWPNASRSLSVDLSQRQILATGEALLNIPTLSFSQGSRKPFKLRPRAGRQERWFERITYSYNGTLNNRYNFRPLSRDTLLARGDTAAAEASWFQALLDPGLFRRATGQDEMLDFSASHRIPVSASFTVNRIPVVNRTIRLNLNTSFNYTEDWYLNTIRQRLADDSLRVISETVPGLFALRRFSSSASANTTIYGIFPFRIGRLDGFRHTLRPSASFTYAPDFNGDFWGYTRTYENATGEEIQYAIIRNASLGREQKTLSFSIANVFESRLAPEGADTIDTRRSTTIKLLDADLSSSYNFAADSLKLSDIRMTARTNLFDRVQINLVTNFSPYAFDEARSRPVDVFIFSPRDFRFARLTRLDLTARASFSSRGARAGSSLASPGLGGGPLVGTGAGMPPPYDPTVDPLQSPYGSGAGEYADFSIPWSLDLSLTYGLSRPFQTLTRRAILNTGFGFNVTPRWKVQGRTGYDFVQGDIVSTDLSIMRDLDCWEMSFRWVPFGRFQSYSFDLHVKSGKLRDLLRLRQPRSDVRGRFSGLIR
ncbi:MAG TPA: putative LPS assembly protein LptD, partial [Rhodothermales bacterium]